MDVKMDPAQEYILAASRNQDAMNAVIDRFDSPVQQFYSDTTLFITGGSGFLGKQLIEKLLRSCKIKKIYLLLREKKGKPIQERLEEILKDEVYDGLREKHPDFAKKIVLISGDVKEKLLGISEKDRLLLKEEVEIIIHMAATVRFDELIRVATLVNVRGTMEVLALAKECGKLKNFIYVSTAYSHATYSRADKDVLEQFYLCPIPPAALVQMAESMEEDRLNSITPSLTHDWPNTYVFTKAVAEDAIRSMGDDFPGCIVRPSIVINSYKEPIPGWIDKSTMFGPSGVLLGKALGVIRVFKVDPKKMLSFVPVDFVNNTIIAAGWDSSQKKGIPVYNIADFDACFTWKFIYDTIAALRYRMSTPKALWYCEVIVTPYSFVYTFLSWIMHLIPAYIIDGINFVLKFKPKNMPTFVSIYTRIDKLVSIFYHFVSNEWRFRATNTVAMISRMSEADKAIYNCDLSTIDQKVFVRLWFLGVRKYLIKDGLKDSVKASQKQKVLFYVNIVVMAIYLSCLAYIVYIFVRFLSSFGW